ncbi:MAG: WD40/YVTN/BNR-like repeat-containing protein [Lysobacterales bacterium]
MRAALSLLLLTVSAAVLATPVDPTLLAGMKARAIGPAAMSGRVAAIAADPADPRTVYVGAATGGVWKSENAGLTWTSIFDREDVHAIGAITLDPNNPQSIWVGTGEGNVRNSTSIGRGVYHSTDGGRTWKFLGLGKSERIHRIVVDPRDGSTAWVAALGPLWGDGGERGVYKTTDGGKNWRAVLPGGVDTGASELVIDPSNPNRLYASLWSFRRTPSGFRSGGSGSGLYRSVDAGETWQPLGVLEGLPKGELGRITLALAPSQPRTLYALVEARKSVLLRSDDGGDHFVVVNESTNVHPRPFYFADLRVDPEQPDRVYRLSTFGEVSHDGGKNFETLIGWDDLHPDHHALWVHPSRGELLINGNDGGVGFSNDRGQTWRFVSNLPLSQFYHVRFDMEQPYNVYGGLQDNGSWRGPSQVWEAGGIQNHHWREVNFGDGFDTMPDPENADRGYAMSQEGYVVRYNLATGEKRMIRPAADDAAVPLRFNWNAAIAQDPFDAATIYFGSQFVHLSRDRGETWTTISPDLTSNDVARQDKAKLGGLTPDVTGAENNTTVIAIEPSPLAEGVIWAGTDDGRLQLTRDRGGSWQSLESKLKGAPRFGFFPRIDASRHDAGRAFVVIDNHRNGDMASYAWRLDDYGAKVRRFDLKGVDGYALALVEDPVEENLLYLGTELGLYLSFDGGDNWIRFSQALPRAVSVMDIAVHPREHDLILGTHGRGIFILDDVDSLRKIARAGVPDAALTALDSTPGVLFVAPQPAGPRFAGAQNFVGENAPYGARLSVWVNDPALPLPDRDQERARLAKLPPAAASDDPDADKPKPLRVEIRDGAGKLMRFAEVEVRQGLNRWTWDLALTAPRSPAPPGLFDPSGPSALPGSYVATLKRGDVSTTLPVEVRLDPRVPATQEALAARLQAMQRAADLQTRLVDALDLINNRKADLDRQKSRLEQLQASAKRADPTRVPDDSDPLVLALKAIETTTKTLDEAAKGLWMDPATTKGYVPPTAAMDKLNEAMWMLDGSLDAPTPAALSYLDRAAELVESRIVAAKDAVAKAAVPEPAS